MSMAFLRNLKVKRKLQGLVFTILALGVGLWLSGFIALEKVMGQADATLGATARATQASDLARDAQAHFKGQVQEFKDMLLRGHDPALMAKYRGNFEKEEATVKDTLGRLQTALPGLGLDPALAAKALQEHARLGEKYRAGLERFQPAVTNSYRTVDESLRGIDRPMGAALGALAKEILANGEAVRTQGTADMHRLRRQILTLQLLLLAGGVLVALVLIQILVGQITRPLKAVS